MLSVLTAAAAVATPCGMLCTDTALRASAVVAHERNSSSCEAWTVVLCGVSPSVKGAPTRANLTKRGKPSMLHTIRMYMLRVSLSVSFSSATRKKQPPFTLWVRAQSTNAQFSNQLTYRAIYTTHRRFSRHHSQQRPALSGSYHTRHLNAVRGTARYSKLGSRKRYTAAVGDVARDLFAEGLRSELRKAVLARTCEPIRAALASLSLPARPPGDEPAASTSPVPGASW